VERVFDIYSFSLLEEVTTILKLLGRYNISTGEFIQEVERKKLEKAENIRKNEEEKQARLSKLKRLLPSCPLCDNTLILRPIFVPQGKRNIYGYRSHFYCSNENCLYEKYSRISADYQMRKLLRKSKGKE